ncbi:MAG: anti-sigma factor family protein [Methylocella sp.]
MRETPRDDQILLVHAALDGELDAVGMMEIEARLAADPALAAEYMRLSALREAIRARIPREAAPESLRARVLAMARTGSPAPTAAPASLRSRILSMAQAAKGTLAAAPQLGLFDSPYRSLAASLMLGIALGAGAAGLFRSPPAGEDIEQAIVAGYVRGRLSGQPVDVATSDRHTVKPWLAGKIASPTTVVDLAKEGFPLVGGRIDVVGTTPVPTLVYQRREHQIALTETPAPGGEASSAPRRETLDGYSLLRWVDNGRLYTAVSDLAPADLDAFGAAFRRAAAAEREEAPKP